MKVISLLALIPLIAAGPNQRRQAPSAVSSASLAPSSVSVSMGTSVAPITPSSSYSPPAATATGSGPVQGAAIPICAGSCLAHAQTAQLFCAPYDQECFCTNQQIQSYLSMCLNSSCTSNELQVGMTFIQNECVGYGNSSMPPGSGTYASGAMSTSLAPAAPSGSASASA